MTSPHSIIPSALTRRITRGGRPPAVKRWRLASWLAEIGVSVDGLPTRAHVEQAHRIFRGACDVVENDAPSTRMNDQRRVEAARTINQLSIGVGLIVGLVLLAAATQCDAQTLFALPQPVASLAPAVNPNLGSVTLGWTHSSSSNVASYSVQYGTNRTSLNNSAGVGYVTNAMITGLMPVNTYHFTVTARSLAGIDSDPSNMVTNFIQPNASMQVDRFKIYYNLPAGRTNVIQSCTNANFVGTIRNILTNSSGGSIWFYATNDAVKNFYRVKP